MTSRERWEVRAQIINTLEAIAQGVKDGKYSSLVVLAAGEDYDSVMFCEPGDEYTLVGLLESRKLELLANEGDLHEETA